MSHKYTKDTNKFEKQQKGKEKRIHTSLTGGRLLLLCGGTTSKSTTLTRRKTGISCLQMIWGRQSSSLSFWWRPSASVTPLFGHLLWNYVLFLINFYDDGKNCLLFDNAFCGSTCNLRPGDIFYQNVHSDMSRVSSNKLPGGLLFQGSLLKRKLIGVG